MASGHLFPDYRQGLQPPVLAGGQARRRKCRLLGSITQNPVGIGECVVHSLSKAIKGEKLEKIIDTGFYWYD